MTGCPCGCATRPGVYDDPDCIRHRPVGEAIDWAAYNDGQLHAGQCVPALCGRPS